MIAFAWLSLSILVVCIVVGFRGGFDEKPSLMKQWDRSFIQASLDQAAESLEEEEG